MSWTLCTSGSAIAKAGAHANSTIIASGSALAVWSTESEGRIVAETRRDFVDSYATVDSGTQGLLADVCSSLVAMKIVGYDTTGYLSREADTLLNVNDDIITKGVNILRDFKSNTIKAV